MGMSSVVEKYVRVVQNIYKDSKTVVRCTDV